MKTFKKIIIVSLSAFFSLSLLYADVLYSFPSEITMYKGQEHNKNIGAGVNIGGISNEICASKNDSLVPLKKGEFESTLTVAGKIPFKKVKIKVKGQEELFASGALIGMRIFNKGLIVTDTKKFTDTNSKKTSPASEAGIRQGDVIVKINSYLPETSEKVSGLLKEGKNEIEILRGNLKMTFYVTPKRDFSDNLLKLGVMVRDSTAGVGTVTYFSPDNLTYGALGHGISDSDTGVLFDTQKGTVEKSHVVSVKKSEEGSPGEILGSFSTDGDILGTVEKNCDEGIFGRLVSNHNLAGTSYPVGLISQVDVGDAQILSTVDDSIKSYEIKILRTLPFKTACKSMIIEITDPELLQKTGGIVQGMSGSPIIQNGKLIGAVTHVFVNDPTRGYGIFIENMLEKAG